MAVRPGPWKQMWLNFRKSVWFFRRKVVYIGEDELGNKYFEKPLDDISRQERFVVRKDKDKWNPPELPNEWFAWLQYKRSDPPSKEEIERNYLLMMRTKFRAAELEMKDKQLLSADYLSNETDSSNSHSSPSNSDHDVNQKNLNGNRWANQTSFPVRSDLELQPGEFISKKNR